MKAAIEDGIVYSPHPKVEIPECSIYKALKEFLKASPERVALIDDKMRLTRAELFSHLRRFAAGFQAQGIGLGDRVCVHLDNSVENMVALFSITFTGASVLLSNPILKEEVCNVEYYLLGTLCSFIQKNCVPNDVRMQLNITA
uniref:AMP-dependent synthetase/ligase domain-containing protein n=1 Tax=Rhipicephalus microplus TaxID=6941 RepID=A0A6M2CPF3_RHIMP